MERALIKVSRWILIVTSLGLSGPFKIIVVLQDTFFASLFCTEGRSTLLVVSHLQKSFPCLISSGVSLLQLIILGEAGMNEDKGTFVMLKV